MKQEHTLEFENFDPSHSMMDFVHEIQERVEDESPSDSFVRTILKRTENTFTGEMRIVSAAGTFLATFSGSDPVRVLSDLATSVRAQIRQWRNTRFSGPAQTVTV